ncbi:MAG: 5,10-methylenetetrahydrofolate reductase [Firmicutes bacterium ADurb.Bin193]|nr:MAG: 5,10-methylenetetrahydrofolate reductase [Firmicutes bacterium ADurb.Bin193]
MRTENLFKNKTVFSFEVFPPKRTAPIDTIYHTLDGIKGLSPDFISVTYGTGGYKNSADTIEIATTIKNKYGIEAVAHLPCINLSKDEVLRLLTEFKRVGIENILVLRGDITPDNQLRTDFRYASEAVAFIKENGDFNLIGACYPEGHNESGDIITDIQNLKTKVDSGVSHLITQMFFDNNYFYSFIERATLAGINVPIQAGIMPVVNKKQIERMVTLCGVKLPKKFVKMMERFEHSPEAMRDAGIAYAVDQIADLLSHGASGIHLYTMNNPYIAQRIKEAVSTLLV